MSTTTLQSGQSFRNAAAQDLETAADFRRLAESYQGDVRERMLIVAQYHEARAALNKFTAERFEKVASDGGATRGAA